MALSLMTAALIPAAVSRAISRPPYRALVAFIMLTRLRQRAAVGIG